MSATLGSVMEAEKMAGLRKVFCVRLGAVRSKLLGISREDERALRREHLEEGVDWREFGNGIWYAAAGVAKLEDVLLAAQNGEAPHPGPLPEEREEKGARRVMGLLTERCGAYQGGRGEAFLVRVMKVGFRNGQVVEVKVEMASGEGRVERGEAGTRGFMRVRTGENFLPGMLCWARVEEGAGCWVFCGRGDRAATEAPVCPRARGRW